MPAPGSDLDQWLHVMDILTKRAQMDAETGIIVNPSFVIPEDFPELRFENGECKNLSPEYPNLERIGMILMMRYEDERSRVVNSRT